MIKAPIQLVARGRFHPGSGLRGSEGRPRLAGVSPAHLHLRGCSVPAGLEWARQGAGWAVVQMLKGSGYWIGPPVNHELVEGAVLMLSPQGRGRIRASLLGELGFRFFCVEPGRLMALFTLDELRFFETAGRKDEFAAKIFAAESALAAGLSGLSARGNENRCLQRLKLLQLFIEAFDNQMEAQAPERAAPGKAKERLETFLRETPTSQLLNVDLLELARITRCTPRHLNRIFHKVAGMSFREKHTELRLARACELLAKTEAKIVDIALESGYQSLSLFNLMFTRRFGVSPGKWRKKQQEGKPAPARFDQKRRVELFVTSL